MARVLFLTHALPYPTDAGPKVRQYHMLKHLATRHDVTLVSWSRSEDHPDAVSHLRSLCSAVHSVPIRRSLRRNLQAAATGLVTGLPIVIARDESAAMAERLRQLMRATAFDLVHADQLSMAGYGLLAASGAGKRPRTLLDEHNAVYLLTRRMAAVEANPLRRMITAREASAFARYEAATLRAFDALLTVTEEDRQQLLALYDPEERTTLADRFTVVPICVDPEQSAVVARKPRLAGEPPTILHLGTMFWPPNANGVLWFARQVLPLVHRSVPDARLVIAGKGPPPEVEQLATDPRIQITGYVPDPRPYLETTDAFIVPLHAGGGMRVKILDAWSWGLPMVSTPIGAEGIEIQAGNNILTAEDAPGFAEATVRLLTDPDLNLRLRRNGRSWVESHYSWRSVYNKVDHVYTTLGC